MNFIRTLSIEDGSFAWWCAEENVIPLFEVLLFRPHQTYLMGTMIHMTAGEQGAGKTFYGFADFQLSDNVAQKTHYGHFTMYAKSIVIKPEYIVRAENVLCLDYIGGAGHDIWDPLDEDHVDCYKANEIICDIFALPTIAKWWTPTCDVLDITGAFNEKLCPTDEARRATDYGPSASIYSEWWGWKSVSNPLSRDYFVDLAPRFNTICFQDHCWLYNPESGKHDHPIVNKGVTKT
jgi:hypothetical protein